MLLNHMTILSNVCAGGNRATLQMLFAMLDLPMLDPPTPVSKNVYTRQFTAVRYAAIHQAEESLYPA